MDDDGDLDRGPRVDVAVVGGGLGGLLAALTATHSAGVRTVHLLEPHPLGGRARCDDRDGFVFNRGPRAIYVGGPAERILTEVGVDTTRGGPPRLDGATVIDDGRAHVMPQGAASALRTTLMSPSEKLTFARAFTRIPHIDPATIVGRSVTEWLDDLKLQGAPRRMVEALIRVATYTDAPDLLDAGAALANAQAGMSPGVRYLDGGWQTLVDDLAARVQAAGVVRREVGVDRVERASGGPIVLHTTDGGSTTAEAVVLATGTPDAAAGLLDGRPASWATLGPAVTVACLELGVRRVPDRRFILGVGEPTYLSTHAPPARLAPDGHAVVHLMRYQRPGEALAAPDQRAVLDRLARDAGLTPADLVAERFLATMTVSGALPTAVAGGLAGRPGVEVEGWPGVFVVGDWVGPTGLLLDAVASSAVSAGRHAAARCATMAPA